MMKKQPTSMTGRRPKPKTAPMPKGGVPMPKGGVPKPKGGVPMPKPSKPRKGVTPMPMPMPGKRGR